MNRNFQGNLKQLLRYLELEEEKLPYTLAYDRPFPFKVSWDWISKITPKNPTDPLLLQILPISTNTKQYHLTDPLNDLQNVSPQSGLIHRYRKRALWLLTGACSIHCQYCFRQFFPYTLHTKKSTSAHALDYITQHTEIEEVILSGGDPLTLSPAAIASILESLCSIAHLKFIRIHTRQITAHPSTITQAMINALKCRLPLTLVTHVNHPNELDAYSLELFCRLKDANIKLFNQSVLLSHVNDDANLLISLSQNLYQQHVTPYYLHLLDPVKGSEYFHTEKQKAFEIYHTMQQDLPGYLLPKLVEDNQHTYKTFYGNQLLERVVKKA